MTLYLKKYLYLHKFFCLVIATMNAFYK